MIHLWLLTALSGSVVEPPTIDEDPNNGPFLGRRKRREEKDLNDLQLFLKKFLETVS